MDAQISRYDTNAFLLHRCEITNDKKKGSERIVRWIHTQDQNSPTTKKKNTVLEA